MDQAGEEDNLLGKGPCKSCGSSDANADYGTHSHCFACGKHTFADKDQPVRQRSGSKVTAEWIEGEYRSLDKRGLSEATCQKFGYSVGQNKFGQTVQIANYRDENGSLVAQHTRTADKSFAWIGDAKSAGLFGQHLWRGTGKRIVVVEGEIDALSVAQAFNLAWDVVSLPNGASNAAKSIRNALEFLEGYEQVVLLFDQDDAGREATAACVPLFSPGKVAVGVMPFKDANETLLQEGVKVLCGCVYNASPWRPDGIVSAHEVRSRVLETPAVGLPWFLPELTEATFGRRLGEVIGFGGGTGCGKTDLFTQQIAYDILVLKLTVGVVYLEQGVGDTGKRIAGKTVGKLFHVPDGSWTQPQLEKAWDAVEATDRLHLYDSWGSMDWETVKARITYLVQVKGCQVVYLDHLTALAAGEADERTALETIMSEAAGLANRLKFCLLFVSHLTTPEKGSPHEEGGRVTIRQFKGSRAIGFWSHTLFGIERDTQKIGSPTTLRVLKERFTGRANGRTFGLGYDAKTGLLAPCSLEQTNAAEAFPDDTDSPF